MIFFTLRKDPKGVIDVFVRDESSKARHIANVAFWSREHTNYKFLAIEDRCVRRLLPSYYKRAKAGNDYSATWPLVWPGELDANQR